MKTAPTAKAPPKRTGSQGRCSGRVHSETLEHHASAIFEVLPIAGGLHPMITDDTIQSVRDRVNIREVIGERVKLERRGQRLLGLCPFHKEKTPSFNVNEERGFYYCFGCHASGDAIKFVQETEGLSFIEAIRDLAQRAGIELVETRSDNERKQHDEVRRRRDELQNVNRSAADYFKQCLATHPLGVCAKEELERRALVPARIGDPIAEALSAFHVGYAPYGWDGLTQHLKRAGFSPRAGESVGLIAPRKSGPGHYDRFRHRLMFAVVDLRGNIVAFSGRSLNEPSPELLAQQGVPSMGTQTEEAAKYINSPESPIYKKRETVFGLFQARAAVRNADDCIVVEGNFDVVSLHARGLQNVVAPLGTAFTADQAAQIKRYASNLTLLFDGDKAGRRACVAAREPCSAAGLLARVATLPDGVDPDDLVRNKGIEAVERCVKNAKGMLDYLIETTLDAGFKVADPQTQGRKIQQVLELIQSEEDPTVRALARAQADTIAARLGISDARSIQALQRAITQAGKPADGPRRLVAAPEHARFVRREGAVEENILGTLIEHPELLQNEQVQGLLAHASGTLALGIAALVRCSANLPQSLDRLPPSLRRLAAQRLAAPELNDAERAEEVLLLGLRKLQRRESREDIRETTEKLRIARDSGDFETEMRLLKELQDRQSARR